MARPPSPNPLPPVGGEGFCLDYKPAWETNLVFR